MQSFFYLKPQGYQIWAIDHLPIPDLILKLHTFNILLFELFPLQRTNWFPSNARATERINNLMCNTTKHGYQSKRIQELANDLLEIHKQNVFLLFGSIHAKMHQF
jgi:hypothetical protein